MSRCGICNYSGEAKKYVAEEMMYGTKEEFKYFECPQCHCLQIEKVPDNLGKYYGDNYYSYNFTDYSDFNENQTKPTRVLDVGCGSGSYLCQLAKDGYRYLTGCDPFLEDDISYPNGVRIYKKTIHEMEGEFDWIYFNDSFEHVTDPHEVMDSICRLLAPQGIARIAIPTYPNIAFDMFGTNWYQLDAPRHIFLHSKESMEYLTKAHGLKIVQREYDSNNSQVIRSFLYEKGVSFWNQTPEIMGQYFTPDEIIEIEKCSQEANEKEYGDHAVFYIVHDNVGTVSVL